MMTVVQPDLESVARQCGSQRNVTLVQDTTAVEYAERRRCTGALALAEDGQPLGLAWIALDHGKASGKMQKPGRAELLEGLDQATALSRRCPGTRFAAVSEASEGVVPLLRRQSSRRDAAGVLVAVKGVRERRALRSVDNEPVWQCLRASEPVAKGRTVRLMRHGPSYVRLQREARTDVQARRFKLQPASGDGLPVAVQAVLVSEPEKKGPGKALDWLLLSTDGEASPRDAWRTAERFERHWLVKHYFSVLKAGLKQEAGWMDWPSDLGTFLEEKALLAWNVFRMRHVARQRPDRPAGPALAGMRAAYWNR